MNERVKELFIQLFGKNNFPKGNAEVYMSAEDLEQFAELIIKETLQIARVGMEFGPSMDEAVYTYFGIEE